MRNIDTMLAQPGIYVVLTRFAMSFVEVDQAGRCFQLELASGDYARDGELPPDGWNRVAVTDIHGPFSRATARAVH